MKRKINGIVTIPAGIAQADEMKIDSPEVEILGARQIRGNTIDEVNVMLEVLYTWKQGDVDNNRRVERPFLWSELSDEQKAIIGEMITEGWKLLLSIPDHANSTPV